MNTPQNHPPQLPPPDDGYEFAGREIDGQEYVTTGQFPIGSRTHTLADLHRAPSLVFDIDVKDRIAHKEGITDKAVLDERINPSVSGHGGRVSLIDLRDKTVFLQLEGGCQGCGMADVTLKQGIEVMIKESVPEIEAIYDVTDHANGKNPYYKEPVG